MDIFKKLFPSLYWKIYLKGWDNAQRVEFLMRKHAPEAMHDRIEKDRRY